METSDEIFENLDRTSGKILLAKFTSKIVFILEGIRGIFRKVRENFLEILWKIYENMSIFKEMFGRFVENKYWTNFSVG